MSDVRVEFDEVYKKFRRGERHRNLRDAIGSCTRRLLRRECQDEVLGDREFFSLKGVSFQAESGECLGIIGPNGAGKSTMLKCASRILRPNRGAVRVAGRVSALIEVGAGFHPDLTGRENVFLNGTILGMRRREVADRFDQIVEFAGMKDFIDTPVKRYSSGMYARLGFSVAAFMDPDVMLIDEVLSVGDMAFSRKCEQKIKDILATDTTVLFISHNLSAVKMICDRVLVLRAGEIVFEGSAGDAIHEYHRLLSRSGNQGQLHPAIRGLGVSLMDELGAPTASVTPGQVATLDVELTADGSIEQASVGFFVRDDQDNELYACTMENLDCEPVRLDSGGVLHARFRFVANLLPGTYSIGTMAQGRTGFETSKGSASLDRSPNRMQLTVSGLTDAHGSANLFAQCETTLADFREPVGQPFEADACRSALPG